MHSADRFSSSVLSDVGARDSPVGYSRIVPPDPTAAPSLSFRSVTKIYAGGQQVLALDGLDLEIGAGEFVALVGESGSGKSTLLHLAGGIDRPTSGEIRVGARDVGGLPERELVLYRRREVGLVFQFFNLLPHLTVRENVELPRRLDGGADAAARAAELLERVGLRARAEAHPYELSGGEMQRVAIARALGSGARLLLADEPTGNLDSRNGEGVLALLDEVRRERGVTLLLATHSSAAASHADRTVRLKDGRAA
jgi:putative ABC transport system ATP-binding protein